MAPEVAVARSESRPMLEPGWSGTGSPSRSERTSGSSLRASASPVRFSRDERSRRRHIFLARIATHLNRHDGDRGRSRTVGCIQGASLKRVCPDRAERAARRRRRRACASRQRSSRSRMQALVNERCRHISRETSREKERHRPNGSRATGQNRRSFHEAEKPLSAGNATCECGAPKLCRIRRGKGGARR